MKERKRPLLSALACVNSKCESYGQAGLENLVVRKVYGQDQIRYLRCRCCGAEFSERKNTAFWNTKIPESRAIEVGRQIAEGTSIKGTSRLTYTHRATVKRLTWIIHDIFQKSLKVFPHNASGDLKSVTL